MICILVTLILSLALMAALFLMIFAAVALVQDRRLFKSAPKDIQAAALEHGEPFHGARAIFFWTGFCLQSHISTSIIIQKRKDVQGIINLASTARSS